MKKRQLRWAGKIPRVAKLLGFRLVDARDGTAVIKMKAAKKHENLIGSVHGGILCDITDAAMGCAFKTLIPAGQIGVTVEFKINFFNPVFAPEELTAYAQTIVRAKTLSYLECELRDSRRKLVAKAAATFKILRS